jgi:paired amphipathic helix protein Sin3a
MRIALCNSDEPSMETDGSSMSRWREYVNTYVMSYPTEWLPDTQKRSSAVFLRRQAKLLQKLILVIEFCLYLDVRTKAVLSLKRSG